MNKAPFDMLKYFGITGDEEDELAITEVTFAAGEWIPIDPLFPDATFLVSLCKNGLKKIAVKHKERVTEFDVKEIIVRDGELTGVDR